MIENKPVVSSFSWKRSAPSGQQQIRAGDWICLMCSNLNFSFRNECNRC